jgi:hypothetical protein
MGADKSDENTPNSPKFTCPNCLSKAKKFGISMKKGFIVLSSVERLIEGRAVVRPYDERKLDDPSFSVYFLTTYINLFEVTSMSGRSNIPFQTRMFEDFG